MKIHGWGRYPIAEATVILPRTITDCVDFIKSHSLIARGLGRSYGDSAHSSTVMQSTYLDHFIRFDTQNGVLACEAGVSIWEILHLIVPKGWFIPVTPGTGYVTIGGAIASDVHGKNHHLSGTFSQCLVSFDLMLGTGEVVTVSPGSMPHLFQATCGGMGLTGVILSATMQLVPITSSQIVQTTIKASCLEAVWERFEENVSSTYSVAWIDCLAKGRQLGRSLLMLGEHAQEGILQVGGNSNSMNVPVDMPSMLLGTYAIKAFNFFYYHKSLSGYQKSILGFEPYFYPLDRLTNWNRLHGRQGFIQYQLVLPKEAGILGTRKILRSVIESEQSVYLAVLKMFGAMNKNYLSFPMPGSTLSLDFKINPETIRLIRKLDELVADMGGRIYLSKDALMTEKTFKAMYPQWQEFEEVRAQYGAIGKFASHQSKRLGLQ